jgi:hypothetical protein
MATCARLKLAIARLRMEENVAQTLRERLLKQLEYCQSLPTEQLLVPHTSQLVAERTRQLALKRERRSEMEAARFLLLGPMLRRRFGIQGSTALACLRFNLIAAFADRVMGVALRCVCRTTCENIWFTGWWHCQFKHVHPLRQLEYGTPVAFLHAAANLPLKFPWRA